MKTALARTDAKPSHCDSTTLPASMLAIVFFTIATIVSGSPPSTYVKKLDDADMLLDQKKYQEGAELMLAGIEEASECHDYGMAYWSAWNLARKTSPAWDDSKRLEWYDLAESYLLKRNKSLLAWKSVDVPNHIQMLCEKETILASHGKIGMAFVTYSKAENVATQYWKDLNHEIEGNYPELQLCVYVSLLLERAAHQQLAGRMDNAEHAFRRSLQVLEEEFPPGDSRDHELRRAFNNFSVMLDLVGRDSESEMYREKAIALQGSSDDRFILQANDLRDESLTEGPSVELFEALMDKAGRLKDAKRGIDALSVRRQAASILYELGKTDEAEAQYGQILEEAEHHHSNAVIANAYFWRGKARSRLGLSGAEQDLCTALEFYRKEGMKPHEYRVYKAYAEFLGRNNRIPEALTIVDEALRLNYAMNLTHLRPQLLALKAHILFQAGDWNHADALWGDALALMDQLDGFSENRRLNVLLQHLKYLASCGETKTLSAELVTARSFVEHSQLTGYQIRNFRDFDSTEYTRLEPVSPLVQRPMDLQPVYSSTRTPPSTDAKTWLWIMNPSMSEQKGRLTINGANPLSWQTNDPPVVEIEMDATNTDTVSETGPEMVMQPGSSLAVYMTCHNPPTNEPCRIKIEWNGSCHLEALWDVTGDADHFTVLNTYHAHLAQQNPFYCIPAYHEVGIDASAATPLNFRACSQTACRIEVYEAEHMRLLAVDADGDGSYTGEGDLLTRDIDRNGFPDTDQAPLPILVYIFPANAISLDDPLDLAVEIMADGHWTPIGTDRLINVNNP